ncbi:MAG: phage major capsid protein, partial [Elusimicrobiaceae bacterium]|nr:phage major capsid protein [Elusimicrobiaceae bacterium]
TGLESITWTKGTNYTEAASEITYKDVVNTVALLKRGYSAGAKWAMNNATLYRDYYGMVDATTGRPIFIADPKAEEIGKILGFEVVIDDNIADGVAYLGNYKKYLGYNMPDGIAIEASRESSFKKGLIDYRALAIADCKPIVNEAFVKLGKATA